MAEEEFYSGEIVIRLRPEVGMDVLKVVEAIKRAVPVGQLASIRPIKETEILKISDPVAYWERRSAA